MLPQPERRKLEAEQFAKVVTTAVALGRRAEAVDWNAVETGLRLEGGSRVDEQQQNDTSVRQQQQLVEQQGAMLKAAVQAWGCDPAAVAQLAKLSVSPRQPASPASSSPTAESPFPTPDSVLVFTLTALLKAKAPLQDRELPFPLRVCIKELHALQNALHLVALLGYEARPAGL